MKKIGLVVNACRDVNFEYTKEIVRWLESKGCAVVAEKDVCGAVGGTPADIGGMCGHCDFIVVLGGDGTILKAARTAALYDKPLIGIKLGTLGYLTDADKSEGISALEKVLAGDYNIQKRMMIEAQIIGRPSAKPIIALNDICVLRGSLSKIINFEIMVNDQYIDSYKADGVIVSTPTGSTAYNLSAGGPILKPDTSLIAVTPICPHNMYSRPYVVSSDDEVYIKILKSQDEDIVLSIDSQERVFLSHGDIIKLCRAQYYTTLIKTNGLGFYDILRKKFYH